MIDRQRGMREKQRDSCQKLGKIFTKLAYKHNQSLFNTITKYNRLKKILSFLLTKKEHLKWDLQNLIRFVKSRFFLYKYIRFVL